MHIVTAKKYQSEHGEINSIPLHLWPMGKERNLGVNTPILLSISRVEEMLFKLETPLLLPEA